jgi:CarboxypepD_reg-like domain/Secretion system C-terminal sorting domain
MSKHIQLHIPEPCHENWSKMTPVEKGRFCGSCQKQVVDFTNMNDEQVVALFKRQNTGSVCGRFMQDQLDRNLAIPKKRIPWVKYFFQFALPAFLLSTKAAAQGKVRVLTGDTIVAPVTPKVEAVERLAVIEQKRERIIRGKVIDDTGEGISYATVLIKGTTTGVSADSIGNFSVKYSGGEDTVALVCSRIGFGEVETVVSLNTIGESVTASLSADNTLKEVMVVAVNETTCRSMIVGGAFRVVERISFIDTIWKKVFPAEQFLKLYPNPVKQNSQLTIETVKHEKGTYSVQLSAMNGQVMLNKELWVDENNRIVKLPVPPVATGTYLLTMINKKSGKRNTEKIIVE